MSQTPRLYRTVTVVNPEGLHARPADLLVRLAKQFESTILILKDGESADCKSILSLLTLGAAQGTELSVVGRWRRRSACTRIDRSIVRSGI